MKAPPHNSLWIGLAAVGGLAYPFVVYLGAAAVPPAFFVLIGLGLITVRMLATRRFSQPRTWIAAFAAAAAALVGLLTVSPNLAARVYPVAVSLAVAGVFALSLKFPPTVVEWVARLSEPDLPPAGVVYTRKVTVAWVVFLCANAAISLATSLFGSLDQWTLWNGLLSYLAMGGMFAGEWLIRRLVRRHTRVLP